MVHETKEQATALQPAQYYHTETRLWLSALVVGSVET
jgi:hypothetical protein